MSFTGPKRQNYEMESYFHAVEILSTAFPNEFKNLNDWMNTFEFKKADIMAGGGARSVISKQIDDFFLKQNWAVKKVDIKTQVDGIAVSSESHKIDNFKNRVGIEVEWNNKTEFFDRDLNNFRHLHQNNCLSVGIIITRSTSLQKLFNSLGIGKKYGASTTHFDKLKQKALRGLSGTCPLIIIGITEKSYRP